MRSQWPWAARRTRRPSAGRGPCVVSSRNSIAMVHHEQPDEGEAHIDDASAEKLLAYDEMLARGESSDSVATDRATLDQGSPPAAATTSSNSGTRRPARTCSRCPATRTPVFNWPGVPMGECLPLAMGRRRSFGMQPQATRGWLNDDRRSIDPC